MRLIAGLVLLVSAGISAAPVSYTTKGRIVLSCGGVEISQHIVETEANERVVNYALANGGKASCVLKYPDKVVVIDIPVAPAAPVCPAKPADETQTAQCPAGSTGSWSQTRTYSSVAAPACWTAGEWIPATAPAGACVADLTAPVLSATRVDGAVAGRHSANLSWSAVQGAATYEIERCTAAGCTRFAPLATVAALAYANTGLPGGFTWRYRVRAIDGARQGQFSNVVDVTTPAPPPPEPPDVPPPPPPPANGSATLKWTPPSHNNDGSALTNLAGYKLYVSNDADPPGGGSVIEIANPSATSYVVEGLSAGTWTFRMTSLSASGAESLSSNSATKVVQ